MENLKKNPLSLQLNVEDFAPASNDEKKKPCRHARERQLLEGRHAPSAQKTRSPWSAWSSSC